jgi:thiol:disulfide interchange protein DsbC
MYFRRSFAAAALMLVTGALCAAAPEEATIRAAVAKAVPDAKIDSIQPSPIKGLYEVMLGGQIIYASADGRYYLNGHIFELPKLEDLTEPRLNAVRKHALDALGESQMIIFEPPAATKHTITVFTDIDCGYCRKLHSQIAEYGKEGIRVRYVFFPRAGKGSPAYKEAISVWCAGDAAARRAALTAAKAGQTIEEKTCDNPVDVHMALVDKFGLHGTPTIVTETGEMIGGYVEPKRLAAKLAGDATGGPAN